MSHDSNGTEDLDEAQQAKLARLDAVLEEMEELIHHHLFLRQLLQHSVLLLKILNV